MLRLSVLLGLTAAAIAVARLLSIGRRPKNYPPGPPTLPLLGNIHQMPKRDAHLQFAKWAKEYGPVYSLILGTQCLIVLSSDEAVKALLDKKSGIYSHRQEMYIGQEVCSGGLRLLMMGYGPKWRGFRKMVHGLLNVTTSKSYVVYQTLENKQMLYEFLTEPDRFLYHIRRYSNALTTTMVFGWRTPTYEDAKMKQLFDGFSEFAEINQTGAAALIDFFPWLRNLPDFLLPLHKKAKDLHKHEKALYLGHWLKAKDDIRRGTIKPCFCVGMAEAQKSEGFDDDQAAYISGTLLEAGSDTTSSTLYAFVQAMLLYPEIQRRAQKEIDEVVGADRMPNMDDQDSLQYIRAIMKETLRWMPTTILGAVPHAVTQDDHYMGYLIPKGAGVMNNVWGIHHDEKRHPSPRVFNPERYINDHQSLGESAANPDGTKRDQFTFGAGRRICPGIHVAERSLFLGMSRILWAFNIEPASDSQGRPIIPDPDRLTQGFVCMPEEFPAKITPRSKARADFVTREWKEAEKACLDPQSKQWLLHPLE
ncbi:cytochrome P450 [Coccidioides immitis RS]|uniref:Cytochrome P450 n=3 Tax=Coccidioides immitis TaxID=5501 RepID=J3KEJ3_COCIM|nr:cytochrome P450 [Coccidioides immitis RS]EAS33915.3 cytochrome P450 [Coccidioides immitis RS]KMP05118.1 O-methylsterigmatocystin oxidoreductase [Coccidioides immitis RMSCC 2394]KMU77645.1 O-methylsterigmatocystin oxidoreductase [Coccidioides immitis RMSCC 3703]